LKVEKVRRRSNRVPVDFNKLTLAPINACVIAEETASLWQIYAMLPPKRDDRLYRFVVTPLADGTFIVARWIEIEEIVHRLLRYDDVRDWTLVDLANYEPPSDYVEPDDHIATKLATIPLANLIQRLKPAHCSGSPGAHHSPGAHCTRRVILAGALLCWTTASSTALSLKNHLCLAISLPIHLRNPAAQNGCSEQRTDIPA
jgi:hypothetical protein